ncbi:MAG: hypothetical protein WBA76_10900, partial [Phormidesmis sp.]
MPNTRYNYCFGTKVMLYEMSKQGYLSEDSVPSPDDLTIQERQIWLNDASEQYFEGKISEDVLQNIQKKL